MGKKCHVFFPVACVLCMLRDVEHKRVYFDIPVVNPPCQTGYPPGAGMMNGMDARFVSPDQASLRRCYLNYSSDVTLFLLSRLL